MGHGLTLINTASHHLLAPLLRGRARDTENAEKTCWLKCHTESEAENQVNLFFDLLPPCLSCSALEPAPQPLLSQSGNAPNKILDVIEKEYWSKLPSNSSREARCLICAFAQEPCEEGVATAPAVGATRCRKAKEEVHSFFRFYDYSCHLERIRDHPCPNCYFSVRSVTLWWLCACTSRAFTG
jgi:hypothetical protein